MIPDYLGIVFDFPKEKVAKHYMTKNKEKIFVNFSPILDHLFEICNPTKKEKPGKFLSEEKAQPIHHSMAQLLFVVT